MRTRNQIIDDLIEATEYRDTEIILNIEHIRDLFNDAIGHLKDASRVVRDNQRLRRHIQQLKSDNAQQARCIENLTDKLNATNDSLPRWISVEDDRKPKHREVLCRYVFDGDSECFYAVLTYYAYGDNGYVTGPHFTGEGLHDMRVTHWMPLPEPPKEE